MRIGLWGRRSPSMTRPLLKVRLSMQNMAVVGELWGPPLLKGAHLFSRVSRGGPTAQARETMVARSWKASSSRRGEDPEFGLLLTMLSPAGRMVTLKLSDHSSKGVSSL